MTLLAFDSNGELPVELICTLEMPEPWVNSITASWEFAAGMFSVVRGMCWRGGIRGGVLGRWSCGPFFYKVK